MDETSAITSEVPLWNHRLLAPPPEITLLYSEAELTAVLPVCNAIPMHLAAPLATGLHTLLNELHLLRSIAYRVGNQFSNCRAFGGIRAVTACGRRVRQVAEPDWFAQRVAALARPQWQAGHAALPSRQMVEHLLVTCQRGGRLLGRLAELAERAARLWMQWLRLGHQAPLAVTFLGLLGRVWDQSRVGRARLCRLYAAVRPLLAVLREAGAPWPHEPLPSCLWDWLGVEVGEGEEDRPAAAAAAVSGGSLRAERRRRHDELPFMDQSREITVSLLSKNGGGGCLDQMFASDDGGGDTGLRSESMSNADVGDESCLNSGNMETVEDPEDSSSNEDMEKSALLEDLGELLDDADVPADLAFSGKESLRPAHVSNGSYKGAGELSEADGQVSWAEGIQQCVESQKLPSMAVEDRELYQRVNKLTRQWKTWEDVAKFVQQESEARRRDRRQCVTNRLSNAQWKLTKLGLKGWRLKWKKRQRRGDEVGAEKAAKRSRMLVKMWSLFPSLEGKKPPEWTAFLERVKNKPSP